MGVVPEAIYGKSVFMAAEWMVTHCYGAVEPSGGSDQCALLSPADIGCFCLPTLTRADPHHMGDLGVQRLIYVAIPQEVYYGRGERPAAAIDWGKKGKGGVLGGGRSPIFSSYSHK